MKPAHDVEEESTSESTVAGMAGAGVAIGELVAISDDGRVPLVVYPGRPGNGAVAARTIVDLFPRHIGRKVALLFEGGDPAKPIVAGTLAGSEANFATDFPLVEADGHRMVISAAQELTLRCGEASIILTREGKVLIRGTFVSTRSSGVNRIVGGAVQIN